MTNQRHADAVRSYLDYLCRCPDNAEVVAWSSWVGRTMGATAMVSLSLGVGTSCSPEYYPAFDGTGGTGVSGGAAATGGSGAMATGGSGGASTGGIVGNAGMEVYGLPTGGQATGGSEAKTTGGTGTAGMGTLYGIPSGGSGAGGVRTDGSGGTIGGMAVTPMYGVPTVGG